MRLLPRNYKNISIDAKTFKLGQLEDIEEELGIDLITLFKTVEQNKIYYRFYDEIQEWSPIKIDLRKNVIWFCWQHHLNKYALKQPLSSYGKTWALTKEELEDVCKN